MKKIALMLLLTGVSASVLAEDVRVVVAANFTAPVKELAPVYEKCHR